ncbi:hypothetical protein NGRA_2260 [Nosema granulosis]|uniref:Uncharacterized protein n=1 Tax=Nosema granulosis TaxID=83296 RepID=A0A9P6KYD8_9MICR|nr:hypothetical protein NGRA_2260 [Nosema granulosis]
MTPSKKINSLKVDHKVLGMLDEVVGDFVKTHPPRNMTDIAKNLQSVQLSYQSLTTKEKKESTWLENIGKKIDELERKKTLLVMYKEDSSSLKGNDLKDARRLIGSQKLV